MIEFHIRARGIRNPRVIRAMDTVPREEFVAPDLTAHAYDDEPLPIEAGQTISQPYIVALMSEALQLRGGEDVLEIGTGSGYGAAVLAMLAGRVFTIERHAELAVSAQARLVRLGYHNVQVRCGDGTVGWPEHAPFGAIVVTAGGPEVPDALLEQLELGGRLVMPVGGSRGDQQLVRVTRIDVHHYRHENLGAVRFVPLIGQHGWDDEEVEHPQAARSAHA